MEKKDKSERSTADDLKSGWTPPDCCPECGNEIIIPVYERHSIACPECRKEIPCESEPEK